MRLINEQNEIDKMMEQIEKLPPATDEDRARWRAQGEEDERNDLTETTRAEHRRHRDHIGPTAEEYMAAHPEVDWTTHEVLYTVVNAGRIKEDGYVIQTRIDRHWVKPDYEALYAAIKEQDEFERVLLRTPSADQVVLKAGFFRQLYTDHCKLMALECAGVDNWDGYADALADLTDDNWAKEITGGEQ